MIKQFWATLLASMFLAGLLGGCNTMSGAGKDMERGGEKIQQEVDEHR